ncbi:MAG TPA: flagellar motor protein MotB [Conexibacter sp.]|jgi:chemotaxis protein MotB
MPAVRGGSRRRKNSSVGNENGERWLLTYADMITLLLALFVVLFAISSVNVSKFRTLQDSLRAAFSGKIVNNGDSVMETGDGATRNAPTSVIPNIVPSKPQVIQPRQVPAPDRPALQARVEEDEFRRIKQEIDQYAAAHGLKNEVEAVVARRGLVVRLLTDRVLFDSGFAVLKPVGMPLLDHVGNILNIDRVHPILIDGYTDDVPISNAQFTSNWELSTARATQVVRYLTAHGVPDMRFTASGNADNHPIASNATPQGRARNRRVEVVLQRLHFPTDNTIDDEPDLQEGLSP